MRLLFTVFLFVFLGFASTSNACEVIREYPYIYEKYINSNARKTGIDSLTGKLRVIAVTPKYDSGRSTYLFLKSEVTGERDVYFLQETNKNCDVTDQDFFFDYNEVKRIIKRKGMEKYGY